MGLLIVRAWRHVLCGGAFGTLVDNVTGAVGGDARVPVGFPLLVAHATYIAPRVWEGAEEVLGISCLSSNWTTPQAQTLCGVSIM
jgi:hypothetical protein